MKIIFMGTPEFAVPIAKALINSKHVVVAVFTSPSRPKGRQLKLTPSPIHQLALKYNIPVYTPTTFKSSEVQDSINAIDADLIVVAAYGFIIPKVILEAKKYGCLNVHPSMLPKYRGAAPLQWTIINGDDQSAVCIMRMDEGLDTGDIILQKSFPVSNEITLSELHDFCANLGASLLIEAIDKIDILPKLPQKNDSDAIYARKLTKEDGRVNWQESAYQIYCKIRGMNPWPGVFFEYKGKTINILEADYDMQQHNFTAGSIINDRFAIACKQGILKIKKLKLAGKNAMSIEEFLRGYYHYN